MTPESTNLCRQYTDVLRASGCSERTIDNYLYSLKGFCRFLGERPLTRASAEDIVAYQVDVAARGLSDSAVRVATYALRGFFQKVLERSDWNYAKLPRPRRPLRLPEVLSQQQVLSILDTAASLKYRCAFMLCYGSGLRTDEVVHLEPRHIDSERMLIRVERGKGQKDRQVLLSTTLLLELRRCWKTYRPQRYLIEGKRPGQPIAATSIQRAFRAACRRAGIEKRAESNPELPQPTWSGEDPHSVTAAEAPLFVGRRNLSHAITPAVPPVLATPSCDRHFEPDTQGPPSPQSLDPVARLSTPEGQDTEE